MIKATHFECACIFFKNKIQKWSFSSIPLPAVKNFIATYYFWYFCQSSSQLRLFTVSFVFFFPERKHQRILRIKLYAEAWILQCSYIYIYNIYNHYIWYTCLFWTDIRLGVREIPQYAKILFPAVTSFGTVTLLQAILFLVSLTLVIKSNYLVSFLKNILIIK